MADSIEEAHDAELVEKPVLGVIERRRNQEEALVGIKNKIFGDAMRVVEDHLRFRDVDPGMDKNRDPAYYKMVEELGEEEAEKAYRLAAVGWQTSGDVPSGVKAAMQMAAAIMKANAAEKGGTKVLNVGKVLISADSIPDFPEREME